MLNIYVIHCLLSSAKSDGLKIKAAWAIRLGASFYLNTNLSLKVSLENGSLLDSFYSSSSCMVDESVNLSISEGSKSSYTHSSALKIATGLNKNILRNSNDRYFSKLQITSYTSRFIKKRARLSVDAFYINASSNSLGIVRKVYTEMKFFSRMRHSATLHTRFKIPLRISSDVCFVSIIFLYF